MLASGGAQADLETERRISVGLRLFPALVAANQDLQPRGANGSLELLLIYRDNRDRARRLAGQLGKLDSIGGHPFRIDIIPAAQLSERRHRPPAGIFLTEWMPTVLPALIRFGIETRTVLFSPFRGDVRQGVLGGLHVTDRILPFINMRTLRAARLRIKPFFLEVAKRYE